MNGPFQAALAGGTNAFVTKLSSVCAIVYSTYLGGSVNDQGLSIAVDSAGAAYIGGMTCSTNFPTVSALQSANGGPPDAFVTKLSASGASLLYSTYLGGSAADNIASGRSIAVDGSGSAYLTGTDFLNQLSNIPASADSSFRQLGRLRDETEPRWDSPGLQHVSGWLEH